MFKQLLNSKAVQVTIYWAQKILMSISLSLIYFIGLFFTRIYMELFRRKLLRTAYPEKGSYWLVAEDYSGKAEGLAQQS
jgi:hypothetical protein